MTLARQEATVAGRRMLARLASEAARSLTRLAEQVVRPLAVAADPPPGAAPAPPSRYSREWLPDDEARARSLILDLPSAEFEASGKAIAEGQIASLLPPDATVVDIGCGIGRIARYVAPLCRTVWAVDASPAMLDMAQDRMRDLANVRYALCHDTHVPAIEDASADLVYSILVLQHLEKEDAFLLMRDILRMLAPAGRALLTFPNILSDEYLESFINCAEAGREFVNNPSRTRFYVAGEVERLILAAGFDAVEVEEGVNIFAVASK